MFESGDRVENSVLTERFSWCWDSRRRREETWDWRSGTWRMVSGIDWVEWGERWGKVYRFGVFGIRRIMFGASVGCLGWSLRCVEM